MKKTILVLFCFVLLHTGCNKEDAPPKYSYPYPSLSDEQKMLQDEFLSMLNDEDNLAPGGHSIDTVKISWMDCDQYEGCDHLIFSVLNVHPNGTLRLDTSDLVVFRDGGMYLLNTSPDSSTVSEAFLRYTGNFYPSDAYMNFTTLSEGATSGPWPYTVTVRSINKTTGYVEINIGGQEIDPAASLGFEMQE